MEIEVWRYGSERRGEDACAGRREPPTQAHCGRSSLAYRYAQDRGIGKLLTPAQKRRVVQAARKQLDISERQACRFVQANRRMIRYVRLLKDDEQLRHRLEELAAERRRFGFRRLTVLLRRDGMVVNIKRVLARLS